MTSHPTHVLLYSARFTSRQRGTGGYISRFCPRYRETAPVKMTPARDDVPQGPVRAVGLVPPADGCARPPPGAAGGHFGCGTGPARAASAQVYA